MIIFENVMGGVEINGNITSSEWGVIVGGSIVTESEEEESCGVLVIGNITSFGSGVIVRDSITSKSNKGYGVLVNGGITSSNTGVYVGDVNSVAGYGI